MITSDNGIIKADRNNISEYREVLAAARNDEIVKLRNGLYATYDAMSNSMIDIETIIHGGILCLYSAWYHYNLSTQVPDAFYVAVDRSKKYTLPSFPEIKLVFQKQEILETGFTVENIDGINIKITNPERSVCDAVKYRNKIGIDVMTEIIDNYLHRSDRNLSLLSAYARKLRVYSTLHSILQVKL